eukprot:COSAG02_NODE_11609_length_1690_cov_2.226901_2_plen_35_part_01
MLVTGTQWTSHIFIVLLSQHYGDVVCETGWALSAA